MRLTRQEMSYPFLPDARFDPVADRKILAWIFDQFLYGEVTGIQVGHWIHVAPDYAAASFLLRQCAEELSHVKSILKILALLGEHPGPAHPLIRFMATGFIGHIWEEHVALEMAQGEALVLAIFYMLADTIDSPEIKRLLEAALVQEEHHVAFGEEQTMQWLAHNPGKGWQLLGLNLVQLWALSALARALPRFLDMEHPVLCHLPAFLRHLRTINSLQLQRLGLLDRPLSQVPLAIQALLIGRAMLARVGKRVFRRRRFLTDHYLDDPTMPWGSLCSDRAAVAALSGASVAESAEEATRT